MDSELPINQKVQPGKRNFLALSILTFVLVALFSGLVLVRQSQEGRSHASSTTVSLSIYPSTENFSVGGQLVYELIATFSGGSSSQHISHITSEVDFTNTYLEMYAAVGASQSGLGNRINVTGVSQANISGKIGIELGLSSGQTGPSTTSPIVIARIPMQALTKTSSTQKLIIGTTKITDTSGATITVSSMTNGSYTIGGSGTTAPTPTTIRLSPTPSVRPTPTSSVRPSPTPTRSAGVPSLTPTPANTGRCSVDTDCLDNQSCTGGQCAAVSCPAQTQCTSSSVSNHACVVQNAPDGAACSGGACQAGQCVSNGGPVSTDTPIPTVISNSNPSPTIDQTNCPRKAQGDANCDGVIDGFDYSYWLNSQCHPVGNQTCQGLTADFNGDGSVDDTDYQIWFTNRGT